MAADSGNPICTFFYDTPCGRMQLVSAGDRLCLCDWLSEEHHGRVLRRLGKELGGDPREEKSEVISEAMRQLDEYFAKERKEFDLPLMFVGTGFQKSVWNALLSIPYGKTESYGARREARKAHGRPRCRRGKRRQRHLHHRALPPGNRI